MKNVETTAAIYGAIAGGALSLLVSTGLYILNRYVLRRLGSIEFENPGDWEFLYLEWMKPQRNEQAEIAYYQTNGIPPQRNYNATEATHAMYSFTAQLHNRKDVAGVLRDVHVAFMKAGQRIFVHYPFDAAGDPLSDIVENLMMVRPSYSHEELARVPIPGRGMDNVRVIQIPSGDVVIRKLRGYISGADLNHLRGGCDEVRLQGTLDPRPPFGRKDFDEHIASVKTAAHQFPEESGSSGWTVGL
jgi:hypothetical protein